MKKRKSGKADKNYFGKEEEKYVVEYLSAKTKEEKDFIFQNKLHYPFYKLAENIYFTYGNEYVDVERITDLIHEMVSVIYEEKLDGFNPSYGFKAYSYFGTILKRWVIAYNKKNTVKHNRTASLEELEETDDIENENYISVSQLTSLSSYLNRWCEETYDNLEDMFDKDSHIHIADAVLTVFTRRDDLKLFKKKAVYLYVREITECDTSQITKVIKKLKEDFYKKYKQLYEEGLIDPSIS